MSELLADDGYLHLLWHAQDVSDRQTLLRESLPDLVILDLWLERSDEGWTFLAHLRADPATVHIPEIVASGTEMATRQIPALVPEPQWTRQCQMVAKPFDLNVLLGMIAAALAGVAGESDTIGA